MMFFRVLKKPYLAVLWSGQLLSAFGDQLFVVAMTWLAAKQFGASTGYILGYSTFLGLMFGIFGGVLADRWNRYKTLIFSDLSRAILMGLISLFILLNGLQVWLLVAILFLEEILATLFDPALQASLPVVAKDEKTLYELNGMMDSTSRFARIIGPGMTGVFLLFITINHFFTLDAISFVLSAISFLLLSSHLKKVLFLKASGTKRASRQILAEFFQDVKTGFLLVHNHKSLFWAIVSLGLINMAWSGAYSLGVALLTTHYLPGGAPLYGLIIGAYGIGNLVSLFLNPLGKRWPQTSMYIGKIVQGLGFIVIAFAPIGAVAIAGAFIAAVGGAFGDLWLLTTIQTDFPSEHIGKIYSFRRTIGNMGMTLGLIFAAPLFSFFSIPIAITVCALIIAITGVVGTVCFYAQ